MSLRLENMNANSFGGRRSSVWLIQAWVNCSTSDADVNLFSDTFFPDGSVQIQRFQVAVIVHGGSPLASEGAAVTNEKVFARRFPSAI